MLQFGRFCVFSRFEFMFFYATDVIFYLIKNFIFLNMKTDWEIYSTFLANEILEKIEEAIY